MAPAAPGGDCKAPGGVWVLVVISFWATRWGRDSLAWVRSVVGRGWAALRGALVVILVVATVAA